MIVKRETSVSSGTAFHYSPSVTSTSVEGEMVQVRDEERLIQPSARARAKMVEAYLRYLRSMGTTVVGADEVARALSLSISEIERIAARLNGVKVER